MTAEEQLQRQMEDFFASFYVDVAVDLEPRNVEVSDEDLRLRILARFAEVSPQGRCLCILCSTDGMEAAEDIDRAVTCFACPCGEISCPVRVLPIRRC